MRPPSRALVLSAVVAFCTVACNDQSPPSPTATPPVRTASVSSATAVLPSATTTATPAAPSATVTAAPATSVDGTVSPLNFGATHSVTIKANPDPPGATGVLTGVRIGVHQEEGGWERVVFEFRDVLPAGSVAYVSDVRACGSGMPVNLPGTATMLVRFTGAATHNHAGQLTLPSTSVTGPGSTVLQLRQTCDFEGEVAWAVGVSGRQRFKVTLLDGPRRVVIDIKS